MIVPMKKITLVTQAQDAENTFASLGRMGVVHIEHVNPPKGREVQLVSGDLALVQQALGILAGNVLEKPKEKDFTVSWKSIALHIIDTKKRYEQLKEYSVTLGRGLDQWKPWGDFDPREIEELRKEGIYAGLYQIPHKQSALLPAGVAVEKISRQGNMANCFIASTSPIEIGYKELELPKMASKAMKARLYEDRRIMLKLEEILKEYGSYARRLTEIKKKLEKDLEFSEARAGMGQEINLVYLRGFIPEEAEPAVMDAARREKWAVIIQEPSEEEPVPTLLRNPRWISFIKPVLKLLEIVPGYRELDVSPAFMIFFSLFFGILIGDAGYGLVYFMLTLCLQKKIGWKLTDKTVFYLLYVLSSCAIIWGVLTASFFGQEWLLKTAFKPLVPALNDKKFMQTFCFFLGALHLSIAHGWRAVLKFPSLTALVDLGWIAVLWSAFSFAKMLILGDSLPGLAIRLLYAGVALVVLFTNPQRNMLKGIGAGLGTLALSLMNNFTDVVSYVRLFAVGMAGMAIADTCNTMAAGVGNGTILALMAGLLITVVGHGLNIILGPMSVLVHGVRLNVLEFSGHVNIGWSGFNYKPLKG